MRVQYVDGTNIAYFNSHRFRKDQKTGYWLSTQFKPSKRLHVYVWECVNGPIPNGYQVHHIDHNKDNNEPNNLELLSVEDHHAIHVNEITPERRQQMRSNMLTKVIPAAVEWHKTKTGKDWHKEHYESMKDKLYVEHDFVCEQCGKPFSSSQVKSRFCSNACKSAYRRASGLDLVTRTCVVCGKDFASPKSKSTQTCSRSCAGVLRWKSNK